MHSFPWSSDMTCNYNFSNSVDKGSPLVWCRGAESFLRCEYSLCCCPLGSLDDCAACELKTATWCRKAMCLCYCDVMTYVGEVSVLRLSWNRSSVSANQQGVWWGGWWQVSVLQKGERWWWFFSNVLDFACFQIYFLIIGLVVSEMFMPIFEINSIQASRVDREKERQTDRWAGKQTETDGLRGTINTIMMKNYRLIASFPFIKTVLIRLSVKTSYNKWKNMKSNKWLIQW